MTQLRLEQLDSHLARQPRRCMSSGDEPLLSLEAADAIRARARSAGFTERIVLADRTLVGRTGAGREHVAFGDKRLIGCASRRVGPALKARRQSRHSAPNRARYRRRGDLPRLDRTGQNSAWFGALDRKER